jgi:uncharacterized protein
VIAVVLDLTEMVDEPGNRWEIPVQYAPTPTADLSLVGPAVGELVVHHTGTDLAFGGRVAARLEVECNRCLERFVLPVEADVEAVVSVSTVHALLAGERASMETDMEAVFSTDGADIGELVRQSLIVSLPMRAICSEDCPGLCPICGRKRTTEGCECDEPAADPRWEALAGWRRG